MSVLIKVQSAAQAKCEINQTKTNCSRKVYWILAEMTRVTGLTDDHLEEASPSGCSFGRGRTLGTIIKAILFYLIQKF